MYESSLRAGDKVRLGSPDELEDVSGVYHDEDGDLVHEDFNEYLDLDMYGSEPSEMYVKCIFGKFVEVGDIKGNRVMENWCIDSWMLVLVENAPSTDTIIQGIS